LREGSRVLVSSLCAEREVPGDALAGRTAAKLRNSKVESPSVLVSVEALGMVRASLAPASVDRVELAMNRLAAALAAVGAREKSAVIVCDGERIGFSVNEALRREKHVPTESRAADT
jgi:hypothetical protein